MIKHYDRWIFFLIFRPAFWGPYSPHWGPPVACGPHFEHLLFKPSLWLHVSAVCPAGSWTADSPQHDAATAVFLWSDLDWMVPLNAAVCLFDVFSDVCPPCCLLLLSADGWSCSCTARLCPPGGAVLQCFHALWCCGWGLQVEDAVRPAALPLFLRLSQCERFNPDWHPDL